MEEKKSDSLDIGARIKYWRKKRELTQEGLARKADIPYTSLSKVESGAIKRPSIQTMMRIAKGLEVGLDELMKQQGK